ncbi:MAG: GYD domain-containing protein [Dehalococcoidia bacterium]
MPTYITLLKWTQEGVKNIKQSPQRLDAAKQAISAAGGTWKNFYLVMGEYDMVVISEAPNDEAYARVMLTIASGGAVSSTTLKAFTEEEYRRVIASLP